MSTSETGIDTNATKQRGKGIDMDAVKQRLEHLKKSKKNSNLTWKPTDKEQTIRIVPYKRQPDNPFIELYFHYNLGGKTYLSPISFGKSDPIMEVAQELKNVGDTESWKLGKDLEPKLRTFAPVIVRGKEHEGVKFWGFGKTIYERLLSTIADPEYGDITDPATGCDLVVWTVKQEGNKYPTPEIRFKRNSSPVTQNRDIIKKIIHEQPDIAELYELKEYEELQVVLDKYLHPEKYENEDDEKEQSSSEQKSSETSENKSQSTSEDKSADTTDKKESEVTEQASSEEIEDAFAELFNQS